MSIGDDLIAQALAAVEKRAEESKRARALEEVDEEDDLDFVFDEDDPGGDDGSDLSVDLGDLDDLVGASTDGLGSSEEVESLHAVLQATREALETAEQALIDTEAERDEALEGRSKARRAAKKYKTALEREVEQRQRLGSTQKLLRDRLQRAEARVESAEADRARLVEAQQTVAADLERAHADIQRLKGREQQAKVAATRKATEKVCKELLPVLDNLELAIRHADTNPEQVVEGVRMVAGQFSAALAAVGLQRVPATPGMPFDPAQHEAMQTVPSSEHPPGSIADELQVGFSFQGRLLRAARVTVTHAPAPSPSPAEPESDTPPPAAPAEASDSPSPEAEA